VKKIEAIIRPEKLEALVEALEAMGHTGLNVTDVRGHGRQKGMKELFRGREYEVRFVPKVKVEVVLKNELVEKAAATIISIAKTGQIGDGKIFISDVADAIRVRTGERGELAI
jgi:nitrogen regulatory protein P-II 1